MEVEVEIKKPVVKQNEGRHLVGEKLLSIDEVRELANKESSLELIELNNMRSQFSNKILGCVMTEECRVSSIIFILNTTPYSVKFMTNFSEYFLTDRLWKKCKNCQFFF